MDNVIMPSETIIIYTLDLIGVFACSVAATVMAKRLNFDMTGAIVVSFAGAIGGGTIRDVLMNRYPIFWLHDLNYFYLIIATSLIVQIFYFQFEKMDNTLRWFDALGLAAFSVIGLEAALSKGMHTPIVIMMAMVTAVMGGVLRDIICRQLPLMLQKEIYSTAALMGGLFYLGLMKLGVSLWIRDVATLLLIFVIRMLAVYQQWNLPNITLMPKNK